MSTIQETTTLAIQHVLESFKAQTLKKTKEEIYEDVLYIYIFQQYAHNMITVANDPNWFNSKELQGLKDCDWSALIDDLTKAWMKMKKPSLGEIKFLASTGITMFIDGKLEQFRVHENKPEKRQKKGSEEKEAKDSEGKMREVGKEPFDNAKGDKSASSESHSDTLGKPAKKARAIAKPAKKEETKSSKNLDKDIGDAKENKKDTKKKTNDKSAKDAGDTRATKKKVDDKSAKDAGDTRAIKKDTAKTGDKSGAQASEKNSKKSGGVKTGSGSKGARRKDQ